MGREIKPSRAHDRRRYRGHQAPLIDHLIELRARLIKALLAFIVMFLISFYFAKDIYNLLVLPFEHVAGPEAKLIYTAPQEYFFTQIKVALFSAAFFPVRWFSASSTPSSRPASTSTSASAFAPYLFATPIFFAARRAAGLFRRHAQSAAVFHRHAAGQEPGRAQIELLPRVSEYLSLIMTLSSPSASFFNCRWC